MNIITLTSFENELVLIKTADAGQSWTPPKIAPVTMAKPVAKKAWAAAPKHSSEVQHALGDLFKSYGTKSISKFGSAKYASSAAGITAGVGAGLSGIRSGMKEWDRRSQENKGEVTPSIRKDREHRAKKAVVNAGLAAAGGGLIGHGGGKLFDKATESAKGVADHSGKVIREEVDRLGGHFQRPFTGAAAADLGKNFAKGMGEEAKGVGENLAEGIKNKVKSVMTDPVKRAKAAGKGLLERARAKGPAAVKNLLKKFRR